MSEEGNRQPPATVHTPATSAFAPNTAVLDQTIAETTRKAREVQPEPTGSPLDKAITLARRWLYDHQQEDGFWVGMLESNSCMEAQWVLAMHFLGREDDPKYGKVIRSILREQRDDGSWEVYYDAPRGDINTTVECYAALRASGMEPSAKPLVKARLWIFKNGGLKQIRNFTKYWLALIGEWPWEETPTLPPELILLPSWAPFNIYQFASWARGTIVPLCILSARRPVRRLSPDRRLDELFPEGRENFDFTLPRKQSWVSWGSIFLGLDRLLAAYVPAKHRPGRKSAIKLCVEWIIKRQESDGAWSGIQPPWIYSLMALRVEGYSMKHPVLRAGLDAFNKHWSYERDGGVYLQASESPVWDTILSMLALLDTKTDFTPSPTLLKALDWILGQQVKAWGDWKVYVSDARGGGWAFQRANSFYPDVDDTAVALLVLARLRPFLSDQKRISEAIQLALEWLLAMQSKDGGWGAFDRDNDRWLLTKIPFADFGEMLDPPSVDVTAHVVEALGVLDYTPDNPVMRKALKYIKDEQEAEGSWFGRWGVNHIYGTAAVLPALKVAGEDMNQPYIRKSADWIANHQNEDGGWGESPASYMDDAMRGVGDSTPSQTGWALMALAAMDSEDYDEPIRRGVEYLVRTQRDGTWEENQYTGTGFPGYSVGEKIDLKNRAKELEQGIELQRAFMINYNLYRHYFPLMALGRVQRRLAVRVK